MNKPNEQAGDFGEHGAIIIHDDGSVEFRGLPDMPDRILQPDESFFSGPDAWMKDFFTEYFNNRVNVLDPIAMKRAAKEAMALDALLREESDPLEYKSETVISDGTLVFRAKGEFLVTTDVRKFCACLDHAKAIDIVVMNDGKIDFEVDYETAATLHK